VPWTADRLYAYLRHGSEALHGTVAGPMAPVVHNLSTVPQEDVRAIAMYVAAMAANPDAMRLAEANRAMARARGEERKAAERDEPAAGAAVYAGACAQCHGENGRFPAVAALNLSLSSALRLPRPDNTLRIVRGGIQPDGGAGPMMPGFANALSDDQMVDLLGYLRGHFTDKPLWSGLKEAVRNANAEPSRIEKATQETTSQ
jgi:mono/diheme cytochrome c family protein